MARVYLGLGSNIDPPQNFRLGIHELSRCFGVLSLSPVYRSTALGFRADDFLNMVVGVDTTTLPADIHALIEGIHDLAGRDRDGKRYTSRPLDIDLLLYDDLVCVFPKFRLPRRDVLEYSFVLRPLSDLAPNLRHPETGETMARHWQAFDAASHPLKAVDVI